MKIANILTMALSSHMARAGQNLSAPDDQTNLLQMRGAATVHAARADAMKDFRGFPLPAHQMAIGADVWMSDCDPQPGSETKPCQNCIDHSDPGIFAAWKATYGTQPEGSWEGGLDEDRETVPWGAGHICCTKLTAEQLSQQPLCGICLRQKAGPVALTGAWGFNPKCAEVYCRAADLRFEITDDYMAELAAQCGGKSDLTHHNNAGSRDLKSPAVGYFSEEFQTTPNAEGELPAIYGSCFNPAKPRPEVFMAVVANNPRKVDIDRIFKANADNLYKMKGHITGTGSSSKQCSKTVCTMKGDAKGHTCLLGGSTTTSGPFGGDVQCGGIVAEDYTEERLRRGRGDFNRAIAGMVFTNDEREPHRLDIIALKRQVEKGLPRERTCWHEESTISPAQVIADVAAEWETVRDFVAPDEATMQDLEVVGHAATIHEQDLQQDLQVVGHAATIHERQGSRMRQRIQQYEEFRRQSFDMDPGEALCSDDRGFCA